MSRYERYVSQVNQYLAQAVGAHYVHGSFGNHPGASNGHPSRTIRLRIPSHGYGDTPRRHPGPVHIHAALCSSDVDVYCCGRPRRATLSPMPSEHMASPEALRSFVRQTAPETQLWPRPDSENPGELVFGESCENKRHFDCIGLVNWVMWSIFHTRKINDIAQCQTAGLAQARQHPELSQTIEAGDILIYGIHHIGIAVDAMHMVEATGAHWGVERNGIRRTGLTAKLRPTDSILRGRWDVRG